LICWRSFIYTLHLFSYTGAFLKLYRFGVFVKQSLPQPRIVSELRVKINSYKRYYSRMLVNSFTGNVGSSNQIPSPKGGKTIKKKKIEDIYQKKTQLEHILLRPDTYIGSVEPMTQTMWVFDPDTKKMVFRNVNFVPGLYKIFDEILVNAADNKIRDPSMDTIKVDINQQEGIISIYNNGKGIPVVIHAAEKVYVPELIFGHLLTSSNYDDEEKKMTGGRNGYGAKLCNIFSTEFIVETADMNTEKKFKQVFKNNMSFKSEPHITSSSIRSEYTKITFKPDFSKFHMTGIDSDLYALFAKRVYDLAGCVKNVKVYFNGERIPINNFKQYTDLYFSNPGTGNLSIGNGENLMAPDDTNDGLGSIIASQEQNQANRSGMGHRPVVYESFSSGRWEICVAASEGQFQQVSFVNSIYTYKGGTHLNHVADRIVTLLVEHIKKKNKAAVNIKPFQVKNHLWIFVNCLIENPAFDSQTKEYMTLNASSFGSKCEITDEFMKKVIKTGITDHVMDWVRQKQDKELKKTDGHKSSRLSGIAKLDDANMAGTKQASKCTLILTEGDSAKALAVSGLSVVGRDYYGVFPLRGKLLNVREANHKQIMENAEINQIKQILGLQHGKEYNSTDTLRYGHVMIMTDQDHDGSHIKGLLINFLDHFWPSLLKVPGFLLEFITPIVKATKGKQELCFYTLPEYEAWKQANQDGKGYYIKYYKGLGTSTAADAKKYFSSMNIHLKGFSKISPEERQLIDMAFNKKKADERKEWLKTFKPGVYMDHSVAKICYSDFIHKELILFSMADNIRSIPSMVDGLKPGLRKVLFACFKRKLVKDEIKLAQLAGYISEHTAYHHGEASLCASIIGMAQDFVGSNNLNLLLPSGQFGTRLQGGKDAASPRYIFTKLSTLTRTVFHIEDDPLLNYLNDDGQNIEPEWYVPILPMVLVNGSEGIGTGWSCSIPPFSPKELARCLLLMLNSDGSRDGLPRLRPWYRGFGGTIETLSTEKYKICGRWKKIDDETLHITELPVGVWTQSYKEFLETLMIPGEKGPAFLRDYQEHHTDTTVHFVLKISKENMRAAEAEGIEKKFKLATTISLANMVCFDNHFGIRKYSTPEEILYDFYDIRLAFYQKRKEHMTTRLTKEWSKFDNQARFIQEIIDGSLVIHKKKRQMIIQELQSRNFKPFTTDNANIEENPVDIDSASQGSVSEHSGFDYLLSMPLWSLTHERIEKLNREKKIKEQELDDLLRKTPKDLWKTDLGALLTQLDKLPEYNTNILEYIESSLSVKSTAVLNDFFSPSLKSPDVIAEPSTPSALPLTQRIAMMLQKSGQQANVDTDQPVLLSAPSKPKPQISTQPLHESASSNLPIPSKRAKTQASTSTKKSKNPPKRKFASIVSDEGELASDDASDLIPTRSNSSTRKSNLIIDDDVYNTTPVVQKKASAPSTRAKKPVSYRISSDSDQGSSESIQSDILSQEDGEDSFSD
jgi:DNA topoisomerase-2